MTLQSRCAAPSSVTLDMKVTVHFATSSLNVKQINLAFMYKLAPPTVVDSWGKWYSNQYSVSESQYLGPRPWMCEQSK